MKKILMSASIDISQHNACAIHFFLLAKYFLKSGYSVEAIVPKPKNNLSTHFYEEGIKITQIFSAKTVKLPNFLSMVFYTPWLIKYLKKEKITIYYSRCNIGSFIPLFFLRLFTSCQIITEHNGWIADEIVMTKGLNIACGICKFTQILDAKFAHQIRVVTKGIHKKLVENKVCSKKVFVVGNGTNTDLIRKKDRLKSLSVLDLNSDMFYLGFVGTLVLWQGVHFLLYALKKILTKNDNVKLIIAGNGPELTDLKKLSIELNIDRSVLFLGNVDQRNLGYVLGSIDIALAPFTKERNSNIGISPLKIRDYAASGLPVISSEIEGITELEKAGWLITHKANDVEDLTRKILELMGDPLKRKEMSNLARNYAETNFDYQIVYHDILTNIG